MVWMRHNAPCNRYVTGERLRLLFPKLKEEKVEILIGALLETEQLEPATSGWDNVGEAWTVTNESLTRYENRILRKREEVRKRLVERILIKLDQIEKRIMEEIQKLRDEVEKEIRERKESEERQKIVC